VEPEGYQLTSPKILIFPQEDASWFRYRCL